MRADYYLIGTVRRQSAEAYRVTIKLTRTDDAVMIWAANFDVQGLSCGQRGRETVVNQVVATVGDIFGMLASAIWSRAKDKQIQGMTAVEAVLRQMHYQTHLADDMHGHTLKSVERAVREQPDFAWGWAALGVLHVDDFALLAGGGAADSAELSRECLRRALKADPTCAYAHSMVAIHGFCDGHLEEAADAAYRTLEYAMGSPTEIGAVASVLNAIGEAGQGRPLIEQALQINPRLPGWVHWGTLLEQLAQGDYRAAIATTERFSMPKCFWDPMLRAMAFAGVGEMDQGLVDQAIRLRPELAERPRELGSRIIKQPHVLDLFVDCIRTAGYSAG